MTNCRICGTLECPAPLVLANVGVAMMRASPMPHIGENIMCTCVARPCVTQW